MPATSDPIAYTYDADTHCPDCAEAAHGLGADGYIGTDSTDREGNAIGAIFSWDEWWNECDTLGCGTCGERIATAHVLPHSEDCADWEPEEDDERDEGQDHESYTDTQDHESYTVSFDGGGGR